MRDNQHRAVKAAVKKAKAQRGMHRVDVDSETYVCAERRVLSDRVDWKLFSRGHVLIAQGISD
jgi:hypothetical protein